MAASIRELESIEEWEIEWENFEKKLASLKV